MLSQKKEYMSSDFVARYNLLANFLNNKLSENQLRNEVPRECVDALQTAYDLVSNNYNPAQDKLIFKLLYGAETIYDDWAVGPYIKHKMVPNRPRYDLSSTQHAASQPVSPPVSQYASHHTLFQTQNVTQNQKVSHQKSNGSNGYFGLSVGFGVLGILGVAIALEPVAWVVGLVVLAVSTPAFCALLAIYAAAVATCFVAAAVFWKLDSKPEHTNTTSLNLAK
ncbi:MAG: hypothetical protein WC785_07120 [Tatlockia sp.]